MTFQTTRDFMKVYGAMVTHDTILPGRNVSKPKTIKDVAVQVCDEYKITMEQILGKNKCAVFAVPRLEAYRRCKNAGFSFPEIGRFFDRDHTSILIGCRSAEKRRASSRGQS